VATTVDKGHGRIEKRTLRTTTVLTAAQQWAGLRQGFEVTRERTVKGVTTVEVVHGITSLSPDRANAATLLDLLRNHWQIENGRHYVRDVTLGEEACRVRSGNAPQVLAALRNAVIHLLAGVAADSRPEAIERLQVHPDHARSLIGIPQCE
jgi:predicted transposase YbfD/YdcC